MITFINVFINTNPRADPSWYKFYFFFVFIQFRNYSILSLSVEITAKDESCSQSVLFRLCLCLLNVENDRSTDEGTVRLVPAGTTLMPQEQSE